MTLTRKIFMTIFVAVYSLLYAVYALTASKHLSKISISMAVIKLLLTQITIIIVDSAVLNYIWKF